jgi:hypothetical protein
MQHQALFCPKKPVKHGLKMTKAMAVCVLHLKMVKDVRRVVHVLKVPNVVTTMANVAVLHHAAHVLKVPKMVKMMANVVVLRHVAHVLRVPKMVTMTANAVVLHHAVHVHHAVMMHLPKNKALAYLPSCN